MNIELFDYHLPAENIAQEPAARRDASRLMVVDRAGKKSTVERRFDELPALLSAGDLIVVNDTKVRPLRLRARRASGGAVEVLLLREFQQPDAPADAAVADAEETPAGSLWEALVRPARRVRPGDRLSIGDGDGQIELVVHGNAPTPGRRLVELAGDPPLDLVLGLWGEMPLPPYIRRGPRDRRSPLDEDRYQTVYAAAFGAVAAPTAGLHFTDALLDALAEAGIELASLTLHVGPGTFQPVRAEQVTEHRMEPESYVLPPETVSAIVATRRRGGRVVGIGTTVVRTLEYAARAAGSVEEAAGEGEADIYIYPGFEFKVVDAMLTNFHLPRSTPILMAAAFAGRERLLEAYELALAADFRFYSYGDAMLIR